MSDYISKPVECRRLFETIAKWTKTNTETPEDETPLKMSDSKGKTKAPRDLGQSSLSPGEAMQSRGDFSG